MIGRKRLMGALCALIVGWPLNVRGQSATPAQPSASADQPASGGTPTADPRMPGTIAMAERLRELVAKANPAKTPPIAPPAKVAEYRDILAKEKRPEQRVLLKAHLGWHLLLDGQTDAAIEQFEAVRAEANLTKLPPNHPFFVNLQELAGLAYLRRAEQQNCIANHTHESCLMPIRGKGVHTLREGAQKARTEFAQMLARNPNDLRMMWLLNIAYMALGDYPDGVPKQFLIPEKAFDSDYPLPRFQDVAGPAGVESLGLSGGVILDDFNNDGLIDIFSTDWGVDKQCHMFQNQGDGKFRDVTIAAGLEGEWGGLNCVQADYNNDGHLDILILRGAWLGDSGQYPNSLLKNLGDGRFEDVTEAAGIMTFRPTQTGVWGDFDNDGNLDLFIGNESFDSQDYPSELYHNNGDGTFTEVSDSSGISIVGRVKGANWGDYDNDGRIDLYVSLFGETNRLYHNEGETDGATRFVEVTEKAGVAEPVGSFPTWFWDFDNDGWQDILVASFSGFVFDGRALRIAVSEYLGTPVNADRIVLYRNQRDGTFQNVAHEMHLDRPLLAMGANFGDLDKDGFLDCYFGTGDPHFATLVPNRMFRNDGGKNFQDVTTAGGFGHLQKGHGIAFADLDNDGDEDIYADMGGSFSGDFYQNALFENPTVDGHWVTIECMGLVANRSAIGARIDVRVLRPDGTSRSIFRTVGSGGSFGASSLQQEIGLGDATRIESIRIRWPGRAEEQVWTDVKLDQSIRLIEEDPEVQRRERPKFRLGGADREHADGHTHGRGSADVGVTNTPTATGPTVAAPSP